MNTSARTIGGLDLMLTFEELSEYLGSRCAGRVDVGRVAELGRPGIRHPVWQRVIIRTSGGGRLPHTVGPVGVHEVYDADPLSPVTGDVHMPARTSRRDLAAVDCAEWRN